MHLTLHEHDDHDDDDDDDKYCNRLVQYRMNFSAYFWSVVCDFTNLVGL